MAYPFKPVEHQVYRNTFLKDVRVAVDFSPVDAEAVNEAQLQAFFSRFKGASIDVADFLAKKNINVISNSRDVEFIFTLNYVEAKLSTPFYSSFEAATPYWQVVLDYADAMGVNQITGLMLRKYSEFSFRSNNADFRIKDVMEEVFSSELMSKIPQSTSFKDLNSFEKTWSETDSDSESTFNVVFGFKRADTDIKDDHLTLVTSVEMNGGPLKKEAFLNTVKEYNEVLYNAFHWCVRSEIIDSMK